MDLSIPKDKIQQILQERYEMYQTFKDDWKDFLKNDTYLIFDKKHWLPNWNAKVEIFENRELFYFFLHSLHQGSSPSFLFLWLWKYFEVAGYFRLYLLHNFRFFSLLIIFDALVSILSL